MTDSIAFVVVVDTNVVPEKILVVKGAVITVNHISGADLIDRKGEGNAGTIQSPSFLVD